MLREKCRFNIKFTLQEAEDWEIIGEEEIKNQKRIRRGGSGSYGRYSTRSKLPTYEIREGKKEFNKKNN